MSESERRPVILLVDDNPHDVVLMRLAFRKAGIIDKISLVKNGIEAVRYLRGEGIYADREMYPLPTLMLLDLNMPQTSGFEVLSWLRDQPQYNGLVVIVMTSSRNDEDMRKARDLGVEHYLIKPSKFSDLVRMMGDLKETLLSGGMSPTVTPPSQAAAPV